MDMRKFLQGRRALSPARASATVAVVAVCGAVLFGVQDSRSTAKDSQFLAQHAVATERAILTAIVAGCQGRQASDRRMLAATEADINTYTDSLHNTRKSLANPLVANSPELTASVKESIRILEVAIVNKRKIVSEGLVNNCPKYQKLLDDLPPEP